MFALVDLAACEEVFLRAANQTVGASDVPGQSWDAGSGCRSGLGHRWSGKLIGPRPHDRIARLRLWKCRPFRRLADRELRPVATLRTGHSQRGTYPRQVTARYVELLSDLDHWCRPHQLVQLFSGNHARP